jgi:hypothetical protein
MLLGPADEVGMADAGSRFSAVRRRWLGVGRSSLDDARRAGAEAAREALTAAGGPGVSPEMAAPRLLIVFSWEGYDGSRLLAGIREIAGDVPLVGCSTAGEIATAGPGDASVVVMALGGAGFSVATSSAAAGSGLRAAGAEAAGCLSRVGDEGAWPYRVLLLLTDGLAGDQQEIVRGAYSVVGAEVPMVGGCAGDGLAMRATFQFHGDEVLQGSVVAAAIASDAPMGIGVRHGLRRVGDPMLVTGSVDNRVYTLDDAPALDVYLTRLQAPAEAWSDSAAFTRFALTHPLGISRRSGEEVRFVAAADFENRSLGCVAHVPQGGLTWFMTGDDESVLRATDRACAAAVAMLGGHPPIGLMAFDCIARRGVLGEPGIHREVERIAGFAAGAPVAGFYTYGEIARTKGISGFHNQTLVVLALA